MKENFTSVNVVIDESGSMGGLTSDTIGSFNAFLAEQKSAEGEAVFTLCSFNTKPRVVHDFVKLASVPELDDKTYVPNGYTALLDALGMTITSVGSKLAAMPEEERPSKVVFLVITDGEENASHEFKREQIKEMVKRQQDEYNWSFVFIGANVDAFTAGTSLGFSAGNSVGYTASARGTQDLYQAVSKNLKAMRGATGVAASAQAKEDFFSYTGDRPDGTKTAPVDPTTPTDKK